MPLQQQQQQQQKKKKKKKKNYKRNYKTILSAKPRPLEEKGLLSGSTER